MNAAAERLQIAPSAIRRKLKELELNLGIELLSRSAHGIEPTALGRVVLDYVTRRFAQDGAMIAHVLELSRLKGGHVRVGLGEAFAADFLSSAFPSYVRQYPEIRFDVQIMHTAQIMHALEGNDVDVGIAFNPPSVQRAVIAIERRSCFSCFVPSSWRKFDSEAAVSIARFADVPCGLLSRNFSARRLIDDAERAAGARLSVVMETNSLYTLRQFVIEGLGAAILPDFAMALDVARGDVRQLGITDPSLNGNPVRVFTSDFSKDSPAIVELLKSMLMHMTLFSDRAAVTVKRPACAPDEHA